MGQRVHRITLERLKRVAALLPGQFVLVATDVRNRKNISDMLFRAQILGYKKLPTISNAITAANVYKIFEHREMLYVARIK